MTGVLLTVAANELLRVLFRDDGRGPGVGVGYALNFCGSDVKQTQSPGATTGGAASIFAESHDVPDVCERCGILVVDQNIERIPVGIRTFGKRAAVRVGKGLDDRSPFRNIRAKNGSDPALHIWPRCARRSRGPCRYAGIYVGLTCIPGRCLLRYHRFRFASRNRRVGA